jgi:hypothetical protein
VIDEDEAMPQPPTELPEGWQPGDPLPPEDDAGARAGGLLARAGVPAPEEKNTDDDRTSGSGDQDYLDSRYEHVEAPPVPDLMPRRVEPGPEVTAWGDKPVETGAYEEAQYLPEHVKEILRPYFDKDLLNNIRVHPKGLPPMSDLGGIKNKGAITLGNDVYFLPGQYDPMTIEGITRIAHELAHSEQVADNRLGLPGFVLKYLGDFAGGYVKHPDVNDAYENIPYEREAVAKAYNVGQDLFNRFHRNELYPNIRRTSNGDENGQ